ncbi:Alpha/Beta hydrolase protein [Daldinia bambusicola]|nr:Alpha/Beta hydrolase protein [Daldinia bambusicola]
MYKQGEARRIRKRNISSSNHHTKTQLLYSQIYASRHDEQLCLPSAGFPGPFVEMFQVGSTFATNIISGPSTISGTYNIFVKLCLPTDPNVLAKVKTVQLLSHGATLDHTYWDISPGYSYVDVASAAGYATLSYDQLGVGKSDHPDPIQAVQATSQVAVTHALAGLLRSSKLGGYKFDKVVGVGHSAGSTLTQAITTQYPKDFDAAILSGTTASADTVALTMAAFNLVNANTDPSEQFQGLAPGYLTEQTSVGIQFAFYRYPNFDDNAFRQQVAHKSTNTLGVLLTLGGIVAPSTSSTASTISSSAAATASSPWTRTRPPWPCSTRPRPRAASRISRRGPDTRSPRIRATRIASSTWSSSYRTTACDC